MKFTTVIPLLSLCAMSFFISPMSLTAQEQLGLRIENYSGVNALTLNPAGNTSNPLGWDVNIIGLGFNISNNLGYIENASVFKAKKFATQIGPDPALNIGYKGTPALEYNFTNKSTYTGSMNLRVMGPSFVVNLANGHSFGVFTSMRAMGASHNLPSYLSPYVMQKMENEENFSIPAFRTAGLLWSEIGFNYAYRIGGGDNTEGGLALGINLKKITAYQGGYLKVYEGSKVARITRDTVQFSSLRGQMAFTTNYDSEPTKANGNGWSLDIGAMLTAEADDDRPYAWRLGASLVDMGNVTLGKNVEVHRVDTKEAFQLQKQNFDNLDSINPRADLVQRFSQLVLGNPTSTLVGSSMIMGMPAALQIQGDYAFTKNLFLNGVLIQRFPVTDNVLERDNLLAVTPRYESRWLGASMPISIINYKQVRMGLAARLGFLTVGTDHLLSYITNSDLYGTDFYFALKLNPFKTGKLSGKGGGSNGNWGKNRRVSCYKF